MRLFLAVTLPEPLQQEIARATAPLRAAAPTVRWVRPDRLHLTMKFLGERPDDEATGIADAARRAIAGLSPVRASLHGAGAFPNFRRPRVVWLGMHPEAPLAAIARRLDAALAPLGVEPESRPFRAHVTLGRVADAMPPAAAAALERDVRQLTSTWSLAVYDIALMQSTLGPGGPTYRVLDTLPLGNR